MIDLSALRSFELDAAGRTAWAGAGLTAGAFTVAAGEHGLATGFGDTGSVGIGGITLAGGIGFLVRKHGLTIDNLLAAEIVTADGRLRRVDAETEPELFWALRGGGGNFGVVTRLKYRLHPVDTIVGGLLVLPATPEVIAGFVAEAEAAPDELSTIANVMPAPPLPFVPEELHGSPVVMARMVYAGDVEAGRRAVAPFRALAEPIADLLRPMKYPEMYPDEQGDRPVAVARDDVRRQRRLAAGGDDPRADRRVIGDDGRLRDPRARRRDGPRARGRHRLRPPPEPDHDQRGGDLRPVHLRALRARRVGRAGSRPRSTTATPAPTPASSRTRASSASARRTPARHGSGWPR